MDNNLVESGCICLREREGGGVAAVVTKKVALLRLLHGIYQNIFSKLHLEKIITNNLELSTFEEPFQVCNWTDTLDVLLSNYKCIAMYKFGINHIIKLIIKCYFHIFRHKEYTIFWFFRSVVLTTKKFLYGSHLFFSVWQGTFPLPQPPVPSFNNIKQVLEVFSFFFYGKSRNLRELWNFPVLSKSPRFPGILISRYWKKFPEKFREDFFPFIFGNSQKYREISRETGIPQTPDRYLKSQITFYV